MNGTAKKILFVEDEPIARTVYGNRLQRDGFETLFAEDGAVALDTLSQVRPDLLVLDLMLPKVNGAEVLKHVRSRENLKKTPVLILSNDYVAELSQKAMESGATRGMLKTECTPAKLAEAVRDMLGYASAFDLSDKPVSDDSQAEAFMAAAREAHADEMILKETREEFLKKAPAETAKIRENCMAYIKAGSTPAGIEQLNSLFQQVRFFATRAGLSGCVRIALLASAFEALLFEIASKPAKATPSMPQTAAQAVDCLERLCQNTDIGAAEPNLKAKILVVDDDAVCNYAMVTALKRAHFEPVSVDDPGKSLEMAQSVHYDIILLDINMPNINGFELCEKLRGMPGYKETPIIFVTSNGDFQNRARSILSGGNDLIPKPISPVELVLKTTIRLLQPQGLWTNASATTGGQRIAAQNGSPMNGHSSPAIPFNGPKPATQSSASEAVNCPATATAEATKLNVPEITIESLKLAEEKKLPNVNGSKKTDVLQPLKIKEESPKVETTACNDTKKPVDPSEKIEPAAPEISIEPLKLVEEEKLPHANGSKKMDELQPLEIKEKLPKIEIPPVAVNPPRPEQPAPLAKETITQPKSEPKHNNMETKNKPTFDEVARGVARIIFGDENITDMNVRLTRIALETYKVATTQNFDEATRGVARIIFGDDKITDMNVRLTRIALERYNITEVLGLPNGSTKSENGAPVALTSF